MHMPVKSWTRFALWLVAFALFVLPGPGRADDWPQWLGPQRDGVWRETGILKQFPSGGPKVLLRSPIGGDYAGPAVSGGKVYGTDRVLAEGARNPDDPFKKAGTRG